MSTGSGGIFISYRRQETAWPARQLYEVLVARFGSAAVFKDVDDIEPGEDFVDKITEAVASCDVLLALIGPHWLSMTDAAGARRLDDPEDFVRLEVEAALTRGVRVVPILVDGAVMPRADQLPSAMAPLARRQAVEINPVGFNTDRLLVTIAAIVEPATAPQPLAPVPDEPAPEPPAVQPPSEPDLFPPVLPVPEAPPDAVVPEPAGEIVPAAPEPTEVATDLGIGPEPVGSEPLPPQPVPPEPVPPEPVPPEPVPPEPVPPEPVPPEPVPIEPAPGPNLRVVALVAGLVVVALVAVALIWRPWERRETAGDSPILTPTASAPTSIGPSEPVPSVSPSVTPPPADLPDPPVLAHRGGLEHHQFETLQAMEDAARAGFAVETDVRYTKDGQAVLVHDERATKGLDCGGKDVRVSETTWAELRKLCRSKPTAADPKTYEIPTLDATLEAIAAASPTSWVFLEAKTDLSAKKLRAFLEVPGKYGLSARTVITSFDRDRLAAIREADPSFRRMLFISGEQIPASELKGDHLWGVAVEQPVATAEYVAELQDVGVKVMVWNPNEPRQWDAAVKMGPDMVMSDYPEKYQEWLQGR